MESPVNFSAGPACLPPEVLENIQKDIPDWFQGMSVMELSHRSVPIMNMRDRLESLMRQLLQIPDDYCVLMMHGGARGQFAALPLNLAFNQDVTYLTTGFWGALAAIEAKKYSTVYEIQGQIKQGHAIPENLNTLIKGRYFHYTENETIDGIEWCVPERLKCAVIADLTSTIMSKPIDWERIDCVYAGAQKNLGIAGVTYVIIKKSLIQEPASVTPEILNYQAVLKADSMVNTPPVFCWYVTLKVLEWVESLGGLDAMATRAQERSTLLYDYIDSSRFFSNTVPTHVRSRLNIPFQIKSNEEAFYREAEQAGLYFLEGHRSVGGARASMYNAMTLQGVKRLTEFMDGFEKKYARS